jgi:DNA-directed RNA polymerase specialized sigma24 family protein
VSFDQVDDADAPHQSLGMVDDGFDAVLDAAEREETVRAVRAGLEQLPDGHARLLRLRYEDGLSPQAIMAREGLLTVNQYERRHRRAIKALARALADMDLRSP